ncbi:MAG: hypothetical protein RL414_898 [Actinomycetota bacterium]
MSLTAKRKRELILWLAVIGIAGAFQFWRGSPVDGVIFSLAALAIFYVGIRKKDLTTIGRTSFFRKYASIYLVIAVSPMAIARIHTHPATVAILAIFPLVLVSREEFDHIPRTRHSMTRSTVLWSIVATAMAVFELAAYITGQITTRDSDFPTISMLVDPMLHHFPGRLLFVAIWTYIGYSLIFAKKKN